MILTSVVYALFFLTTALLYYILPGKFRWVWILLASIFFYMYARAAYIIIPFFTILVTYFAGIQIEKATTHNKAQLFYLGGIGVNIALLVFFKYTNFFISVANDLFHAGFNPLNILLPVGNNFERRQQKYSVQCTKYNE